MEIAGCSVPDELRVDVENGVWLRLTAPGLGQLGLLAPFVAFAGRVVGLTFRPSVGTLTAGVSIATLESTRLTAPVRVPVAARIERQNEAVVARPRTLNDDPYGAGWLVTLALLEEGSALPPTASEAREALERQIHQRRVRCYAALPDLEVYEIGSECRAILARLDDELAHRAAGEVVLLVVDDPTAPLEMARWSDRTGHELLEQRRQDGLLHFLVRKLADPKPRSRSPGGELDRA